MQSMVKPLTLATVAQELLQEKNACGIVSAGAKHEVRVCARILACMRVKSFSLGIMTRRHSMLFRFGGFTGCFMNMKEMSLSI